MALKSIKRLILSIDGASIKLSLLLGVVNQFLVIKRSKYAMHEITPFENNNTQLFEQSTSCKCLGDMKISARIATAYHRE
jgi:hexokinase